MTSVDSLTFPTEQQVKAGSCFVGRRLLFVVNEADFFISHRLAIAAAAKAEGFEVHVATPNSPSAERIEKMGIQFHPISLSRRGMNPLWDFVTFTNLVRLFWKLRPDIVHNVTIKPVIYGGLAAKLVNVPAVVSAVSGLGYVFVDRGFIGRFLRAAVLSAYGFALAHRNARVIIQNPDDESLLRCAGVVDSAAVALIRGSGVDLALFQPVKQPVGIPFVVLASRMLWDKGIAEFVDAARRIKKSGVAARFVLVGDTDFGNPSAVPRKQLEDWGREGVVEWWGRHDDMPAVFARANIVCLPSYREGLPKVLIEAAACGRAIVATDVPGCREIVRHGENGLLVPSHDSASLAKAIHRLLENADERQSMGERGRRTAEAEFSVERVIQQTLEIYRDLLHQ